MKILKRCPFCHRIVWFWQSKAYLDARRKKPCHALCWWIDVVRMQTESKRGLRAKIRRMNIDEFIRCSMEPDIKKGDWTLYQREKEVEKVEDDTWRKGRGIKK